MDFRKLEIFCRVYELGGVTSAANSLHLTQPAVTAHLRRIEEEVGHTLFIREHRGITPTAAGEVLYTYAREIVDTYCKSKVHLERLKKEPEQKLSIGCPPALLYILPALLANVRQSLPDLVVTMRTAVCRYVCEAIADDIVDVGLVWGPVVREDLIQEQLMSLEFIGVAHPGRFGPDSDLVPVERFAEERLLLPVRESGTRDYIEHKLKSLSIKPRAAMEFDDVEAMKRAVKADLGIAFVARIAVEEDLQKGTLKQFRLDESRMLREVLVVTHTVADDSSPIQFFVETARNVAFSINLDHVGTIEGDRIEAIR